MNETTKYLLVVEALSWISSVPCSNALVESKHILNFIIEEAHLIERIENGRCGKLFQCGHRDRKAKKAKQENRETR